MRHDAETTKADRWAAVAAVEREIRLMAYTSAGDPTRMDDMRMYAIWAGRLQNGNQRLPDTETTKPRGYPVDQDNPDDWAGFLAHYMDNRATNTVHNGIGLVALHIVDAIKEARANGK